MEPVGDYPEQPSHWDLASDATILPEHYSETQAKDDGDCKGEEIHDYSLRVF